MTNKENRYIKEWAQIHFIDAAKRLEEFVMRISWDKRTKEQDVILKEVQELLSEGTL